jgi:hypothetical protein
VPRTLEQGRISTPADEAPNHALTGKTSDTNELGTSTESASVSVHLPSRWKQALLVSRKVVTAAEPKEMTPAEQQAVFDASFVSDLSQVPPEFLSRVRSRLEQHIDQSESTPK